jgi:uncharacterized protein (AIM24 family)
VTAFVSRCDRAGRLDEHFGQSGITHISFDGPGPDTATALARLDDGRLIVAGHAFLAGTNGIDRGYAFALARLTI